MHEIQLYQLDTDGDLSFNTLAKQFRDLSPSDATVMSSPNTVTWVDSLDTPHVLICHQIKTWDTDVLGMLVGAVTCFAIQPGAQEVAVCAARAYSTWLRESGYALVSARLEPNQIAAIQALEFAGFRFTEVYVTLERDLHQIPPQPIVLEIDTATPEDAGQVGEIAATSFVYDRLHADHRVDDCQADAFKRAWVENSCRGYAEAVLLARIDEQIVGFVTLRTRTHGPQGMRFAVIDLIGVKRDFQRRGVGKALVEAASEWTISQDLTQIKVGTQAANTSSLQLYRRCGFQICQLQVTLQWLV